MGGGWGSASYKYAVGLATRGAARRGAGGGGSPCSSARAGGQRGSVQPRASSRSPNCGQRGHAERKKGPHSEAPLVPPLLPHRPPATSPAGAGGAAPTGRREGAGASGPKAIGPEAPRRAPAHLLGIWRRRLGPAGRTLMERPRCSLPGCWISRRPSTRGERGGGGGGRGSLAAPTTWRMPGDKWTPTPARRSQEGLEEFGGLCKNLRARLCALDPEQRGAQRHLS